MPQQLANVHPGEVLLEEFLKPLAISQNRLAREIRVRPRLVNEIVLGKRAITPDSALRLARYFWTSERFWLGLQMDFDLEEARAALAETLERGIQPVAPAA
ncbi:MAG: antitoxin HigA [Acidobacteriota bacterium]|jgi:addiction module HigA family antidote|nr:antitoxin HigA [Acidobacteriota bacterium]